jgi:16S rRNA U516 pseudouridylate synthase RsuA-like enzyme
MPTFTRRIQAVLSEGQYRDLIRIAKKRHKPVSHLVREAIEKVYFGGSAIEDRRGALAELLSMDAPVADWGQMEDEIILGAMETKV